MAEGATLADDAGWDQLTLAALAARFGVAVPSLYKHVDGLPALRRGISVLAVNELGAVLAAADRRAAPDPDARLRALAEAYRRWALRHPGRYDATVRAAPVGDREHVAASDRVLRLVLEILQEQGLGGDAAVDAARTLRAALHGFVVLEMSGGFGLSRDVERSFAAMVATIQRGLDA
jgi:AcrR family transcriptional regulator